ncbi:MAG: hypothetical protein LBV19_04385 [Streptococcaceae bacterium]|jgi:hypothetical protein|nr:hypothetical protein [Streptococcaceae bacterium]
MADYPKCIKAEMLPGPELQCEFDNGETRYFPINEQIDLLMFPEDLTRLKKTHGANLFMGGAMTWIGNDILIEDNGDVLVNKKVIPAEMLWKYGKKHLTSSNSGLLNDDDPAVKHPIVTGFKRLTLLWILVGICLLIGIIFGIASLF